MMLRIVLLSIVLTLALAAACRDGDGPSNLSGLPSPETTSVATPGSTPALTIPSPLGPTGVSTPEPTNIGLFLVDLVTGDVQRLATDGTFSPDGRLLAIRNFADDGVEVLTIATGERVRVFDHRPSRLSWSADGRRIAIEEVAGGLFVANADGSGYREVLEEGGNPSWSPRGDRIAVLQIKLHDDQTPSTASFTMVILDPDGEGMSVLPLGSYLRASGGDASGPFWSPSGVKVAAVRQFGEQAAELIVIDVDSDTTTISELGQERFVPSDLLWAPGEREIALAPSGWSEQSKLYIVEPGSSVPPKLLAVGINPVWSPDGRRIVFIGNVCQIDDTGYGFDLMVINRDGSGLRMLTLPEAGEVFSMAISPTDERIAFQSSGEIYTVLPDGSELRRLLDWQSSIKRIGWTPEGDHLYFRSVGGFDLCLGSSSN